MDRRIVLIVHGDETLTQHELSTASGRDAGDAISGWYLHDVKWSDTEGVGIVVVSKELLPSAYKATVVLKMFALLAREILAGLEKQRTENDWPEPR